MERQKMSTRIIKVILSVVVIALLYYLMLPPINLKSQDFVMFLIISILVILVINCLAALKDFLSNLGGRANVQIEQDPETGQMRMRRVEPEKKEGSSITRPLKIGFIAIGLLVALWVIASVIGMQLFNAIRYRDIITIEDGDFAVDVAELSMSQIPVVDHDTAARLGSRKLGEMTELVSQFEITDIYTQINYRGTPYRVTPLKYADPIKWFYNMKEGLPAYITVNMVTQNTELVWLEDGMKYSPSEYFFRNIYRHIRIHYPTKIIGTVSFEIDDDGVPYWVAPTITYRIGWWSGKDINGAILVNAVTGESQYYAKEDVPEWIDQLYDSDLIVTQLNYNGRFQNGFINSIFGQKNVRQTTDGYNYLAIGDDVYLYTGMTSVIGDQSNIGFVLVNLRTKETKFYTVPGATETSAMASARGQVQHLNYTATFPLLLNISDRPTYFMSLKDNAGLVKMYAFVDVEQYQIVGTGSTIDEARRAYREALNLEDVEIPLTQDIEDTSGTVEELVPVVLSGDSCIYFKLKDDDKVYAGYVTVDPELAFMKEGDKITFSYSTDEDPYIVTEVEEIK